VKTGVSTLTLLLVFLGLWILGNLLTIRLFGQLFTGMRNTLFTALPVLNVIFRFFVDLASKIQNSFSSSGGLGVPCLLEYPRKGLWIQAFLTKTFISTKTGEELGVVQIYTAPNPIGGVMVVVPLKDLRMCETPLSEAVEYSISLGTVLSSQLIGDFSDALASEKIKKVPSERPMEPFSSVEALALTTGSESFMIL
jgi:uncharacterized membrane protein